MSSRARRQTTLATALLAALGIVPILAPGLDAEELNSLALRLVDEHQEKIQPLEIDVARRYWDANVSGTREAFRLKQEAENRLDAALSDQDWFARLKRCDAAPLADPLLARQIRLLYLQTLPKQVDRELLGQLVARANGIEMQFNTYRPRVGDEQFTANEVRRVYEKPKKHPSAFCLDIDRAGDVRVLANVEPREFAMSTMLHELAHAVYSSKNMPAELPYLLRCESHILTTEGVAMLFEPFSKDAQWLRQMDVEVDDHAALDGAVQAMRRQKLLVFARFSQVVQRFERELYRDPDQDLNRLWWDLVEKYQGLTRPERRDAPDYASQLHIVTAPAYFHNYMLGELFACQLRGAIARDVLGGVDPRNACYVGRVEVGRFLRERVFEPGRRLGWNELTKFATGEELGVRAFAEEVAE